jgi:hypothetical protein
MQNVRVTPESAAAWTMCFSDTSAQDFQIAFMAAIKEPGRKFFPTPGEVNKALIVLNEDVQPPALEIWDWLMGRARAGSNQALVLKALDGNPAAQSAIRQIGFDTLRLCDVETELPHRKRDFERLYNDSIDRSNAQERVDNIQQQIAPIDSLLANIGIKNIKTIGG